MSEWWVNGVSATKDLQGENMLMLQAITSASYIKACTAQLLSRNLKSLLA